MIAGLLILAMLILLVALLARNMIPSRHEARGDAGDLTAPTAYTPDHGAHHGDHGFGDGGAH